jgi:hypothetical protein
MSGTENGITLGSPIACVVHNKDTRPEDYQFGEGGDNASGEEVSIISLGVYS